MTALADETARAPERPIKVFVHLAHGETPAVWQALADKGKLIGFNDDMPYGYHRAEKMGCEVVYSSQGTKSRLINFVRLGLRVVLGFDLLHAWYNRKEALASDIIWTHTEAQLLGMCAILSLRGKKKPRPKVLGNSVWFMDIWLKLDPVRKALYRRLVKKADCLTFHSPLNLEIAKGVFPDKRCELMRFGIPTEVLNAPKPRQNSPHRVICIGNDRHRDWQTVMAAFKDQPDIDVKIFTTKTNPSVAADYPNIEIRGLKDDAELKSQLAEASLMIVPLIPNVHASGATVTQEAVITGIPCIVSRAGGLEAYFDDTQISWVEPKSPEALRAAAVELLEDPEAACAQAQRAQAKLVSGEIGSHAHARDHVIITRQLLDLPPLSEDQLKGPEPRII